MNYERNMGYCYFNNVINNLFDVLQKERIDSHVLFDKILFNNFQFNKLKIETCM